MDEITHTIMPGNNGGWGGTALGAGVGGLIGSWLGNGGFGGYGRPGEQAARNLQNKAGGGTPPGTGGRQYAPAAH